LTPPLGERLARLARDGKPGSTVLVTSHDETSTSVVAVLLDAAGDPRLVAKLPRLPDTRDGIVREAAVLREIQARRSTATVPSVVELVSTEAETMLVETALVGKTITPTELRRRPRRAVRDVLRWLSELPEPGPEPADFDLLVERPLALLEAALPPEAPERTLATRTRAAVEPLRRARLTAVVEHGDLSHPNLIRLRDGRVGVVDWELAETAGLPLCDLCFFLAYVATSRRRARTPEELAAAFDEAFASPDAWARAPLLSYVRRIGLDPSLTAPLLAATWGRYVVRIVARVEGSAELAAPISKIALEALRRSPHRVLWEHVLEAPPRFDRES
jgi:aminoglycoside phosphotransferase